MNRKNMFQPLTRDIVFKTIWLRGDKDARSYLERMVEFALEHKLRAYHISANELGVANYDAIANKVDILLESDDRQEKVNIEMNRILNSNNTKLIDKSDNKNGIYLAIIISCYYNDKDELYKDPIQVYQVNFNTFYFREDKSITKLSFKMVDRTYDIVREGVVMHDLYLPALRDLCYNGDTDDIYKDFAMMLCDSIDDMEELAKGDKSREAVVKFLRKLEGDEEFMALIDREAYFDSLRKTEMEEAVKEGLAKGHAEGRAEGIAENILDNARTLYQNGASKDLILKSLDIEEAVLDQIIAEVDSTKE